ncbi:Wadjet anti-phage system protein JetD domain-containing protein [Thermomonas sp.]|uniref:Wadjet anti-phage system protein JetD domain-containing protein n=1 Tax=Thermomonas sp. TaxID=1971895 RepID=UPI002613CEDD|nr:Wadjet anti-phage system protein JetD domain-containing protein [Thermomonas sp.]
MSAARQLLERLLRRAESARLRGADEHVSLPMGGAAEYLALRSLDELEIFHGEIALAEHDGAITAQREGRSGDGSKLLRLAVADTCALARHLHIELLDDRVAQAERTLEPWRARFPVLDEVIAAWRANRKPRGTGPEAAGELADAARAVAARLDDAGHERILRRESVRLFGDSKQLEKLTPWLDILVAGELAASGLSKEEVWSAIGLRREPQPMLLAGIGSVELADATLPLVRPYLGLPVESVRAVATAARCVLTVENLASFHDATRSPDAASTLLLYTGGMPSPAWRDAYARLLASLPTALPVYHWGDIDEGGFRIAAVLAATARDAGHVLQPWLMSPATLPARVADAADMPAPAALAAMQRWATRSGWPQVAEALARRPLRLEQETLDPAMPPVDSGRVG